MKRLFIIFLVISNASALITGRVVERQGVPLSGCEIRLDGRSSVLATTSSSGTFQIDSQAVHITKPLFLLNDELLSATIRDVSGKVVKKYSQLSMSIDDFISTVELSENGVFHLELNFEHATKSTLINALGGKLSLISNTQPTPQEVAPFLKNGSEVDSVLLTFECPNAEKQYIMVGKNGSMGDIPIFTKPNFIILFPDDMGYTDLGAFGSHTIKTPVMDQLVQEGIKFTSMYAQPVCGASRTSIMTGSYPLRVAQEGGHNAARTNRHPIVSLSEITIAEQLKQAGYKNVIAGKWDLAKHSHSPILNLMPLFQGFDTHFGPPSSNDALSAMPIYLDNTVIESPIQDRATTRRFTNFTIDFIVENKDKPFFAYVAYSNPHIELYAESDFVNNASRLYDATVQEIDYHVGRLVDTLKAMNLAENTYIIFASDNGPWLHPSLTNNNTEGTSHTLRAGKLASWEGGSRVPGFVWAPRRIRSGHVYEDIVTTMDFLPTLSELAGVELPTDRVLDGKSIVPIFRSNGDYRDTTRTFFYYDLDRLRAVRNGDWKLHLVAPKLSVLGHNKPEDEAAVTQPELYNLRDDLKETTNVAAQHPDIVQRLEGYANEIRSNLGDWDRFGPGKR
jgi:arylsulfatase